MNSSILKERIRMVLTTTTMTQAPEYSTNVVSNEDGTVQMEIDSTVKNVSMDENMADVIAEAVASSVVEFLKESVQVQVPNATAGAATLTGSLV